MTSKTRKTLVSLLSLAFLSFCFVSCGNKQAEIQPPLDVSGVKVDVPKLQHEFMTAPQELQDSLHQTTSSIRYGQYEKALQSLAKLLNVPGLTDSQKKIVTEVIEQMKQVISKVGPSR
jgi:hypothetical protein